MPPAVSIIMAVRDDAQRLPRTLRSIANQSFEDWELIVIDDGSVDGSLAAAEKIAAGDLRIRVVQGERVGIAHSRNRGMAEATGRWLAVADSDDLWHPRKLELQLAFLADHPSVGLLGCYGYRIAASGKRLGTFDLGPRSIQEFERHRETATPFGLIHASALFQRQLFEQAGGYPCDYPLGLDLAYFNLRLAPHTDVMTMPDRLVFIEVRPDSVQRRRVHHAVDAHDSVALNLRRQRTGLPELPYREAVAALSEGPLWSRLAQRRIRERHRRYTRGASALAAGSASGLPDLALAVLVAPVYSTRRLISQVAPLALEQLRKQAPPRALKRQR
jgi:glycosyltransferase involved in cell wall biosynthesis